MEVTVKTDYLVFPVNPDSPARKFSFILNEKTVYEINIKFDNSDPQFYAYIDVSRFHGSKLVLKALPETDIVFYEKDSIDTPDLYNEPLRPRIHFTAKNGWINDPNGLIYIDGIYHLFFQYEPTDIRPSRMHWGHAESRDLIHWQEKDVALFPDERGAVWSGSAIADSKNLLGKNEGENTAALLYYTTTEPFVQNISYSTDGFRTIKTFEGNPVLPHIMGTNRDPKVIFCDELDCYIMSLHLKTNLYALFRSDDLVHWTELQRIELHDGECPDLFPLTDNNGTRKWLFMGAGDKYFVGDFINGKFVPSQEQKALHFGNSSRAGQSFSNLPGGRTVRMVWNENWCFDSKNFAGQLGIPMELSLCMHNGIHYLQANPVKEIKGLYSDTLCRDSIYVTPAKSFEHPLENFPYLIKLKSDMYKKGSMTVSYFGVSVNIDFDKNEIRIGDCRAPLSVTGDAVDITLIIDRCSTELYADGGKIYMSCLGDFTLCNPDIPYLTLKSDTDITIGYLELNSLNSIWNQN